VNHYGNYWKTATNAILYRILARGQQIPCRIEMHASLVLYNVWAGSPCSHARAITALIQEIKTKIVYRRCRRETTNRAIYCNCISRPRSFFFIKFVPL
jgi:hypothetical protein